MTIRRTTLADKGVEFDAVDVDGKLHAGSPWLSLGRSVDVITDGGTPVTVISRRAFEVLLKSCDRLEMLCQWEKQWLPDG